MAAATAAPATAPASASDGGRRRPYDPYHGKYLSELEREMVDARLRQKDRRLVLVYERPGQDEEGWLKERRPLLRRRLLRGAAELPRSLSDRWPWRHALLVHYVTETDTTIWSWSEASLEQIEETVGWIAGEMPLPIRVPSWVRQAHKRTVSRRPN